MDSQKIVVVEKGVEVEEVAALITCCTSAKAQTR